jgi:hypothetical protein
MVHLSATRCNCIAILWVSLVSFAAITLCVTSQQVLTVVNVYFVIDSVRKLLDTPSYLLFKFQFLRCRDSPFAVKNTVWHMRLFHGLYGADWSQLPAMVITIPKGGDEHRTSRSTLVGVMKRNEGEGLVTRTPSLSNFCFPSLPFKFTPIICIMHQSPRVTNIHCTHRPLGGGCYSFHIQHRHLMTQNIHVIYIHTYIHTYILRCQE